MRVDGDKLLALVKRTKKKAFHKGILAAIAISDATVVRLDDLIKQIESGPIMNGRRPDAVGPRSSYETAIQLSTRLRSLLNLKEEED